MEKTHYCPFSSPFSETCRPVPTCGLWLGNHRTNTLRTGITHHFERLHLLCDVWVSASLEGVSVPQLCHPIILGTTAPKQRGEF